MEYPEVQRFESVQTESNQCICFFHTIPTQSPFDTMDNNYCLRAKNVTNSKCLPESKKDVGVEVASHPHNSSKNLSKKQSAASSSPKSSDQRCSYTDNNHDDDLVLLFIRKSYNGFNWNPLKINNHLSMKFLLIFVLNMISFKLIIQLSNTNMIMVNAAETKSSVDTFNIDKLLEYNELVSCFGQMHKEFEQCNKRGAEKAKSFFAQIELSQEWNKRLKCCGTWKLRDCWMKAARQKCTKIQADMVYKLPHLIMPALVEECADYTPESGKCSLPIWLILVVILVAIFLLLTCCLSVIYCVRRRNNKREFRRQGHPGSKSYSKMNQNGSIKTNGTMPNRIKSNNNPHFPPDQNFRDVEKSTTTTFPMHKGSTFKTTSETPLDNVDSELNNGTITNE